MTRGVRVGAASISAALVLVGLAGCASGHAGWSATPSTTPAEPPAVGAQPGHPEPLAAPDSTRRIVYDPALVSEPVTGSKKVAVPAREAIARAARQTTISPTQQPGTPEATLRVVYRDVATADRKVGGRLSWLLTWRDSAPDVHGPVSLTPEQRRRVAAALECVFVVTVDAQNGQSTNALQLCVPK